MIDRLSKRLENIPGKELTVILSKVARIDEFKGWWKGAVSLSPQILSRLKKSVVITSSGASTRIEGSRLSDKEVEKLLKGLKVSKLRDRDSQEVAGYAEILQMVFNDYRSMKFTEGLILQFHNISLKYSHKDQRHKGQYKKIPNKVIAFDKNGRESVIFNPTEPHLTPFEMKELVEWTKSNLDSSDIHSLIVIANFILEFLAIHPFQDGNGRLSRILTNLLLLQVGYTYMPYASLEKIVEDHKAEYYLSLKESQKNIKSSKANVVPWLNYFLDTLLIQIEVLKQLLEGTPTENILSDNQLKVLNLFNRYEEISSRIVTKELKIPTPTVKQVFNRLIELKMVERVGLGRGIRYRKIDFDAKS